MGGLQTDEQFLLSAFLAAFTSVYVVTARQFLSKKKHQTNLKKEKLWSALSAGFAQATLETVNDVVNVYKGVYGLGNEDATYRAGLAKQLREFLVFIISSEDFEKDETLRISQHVTVIIDTIEAENPFSDMPAAERNLMIDVEELIKHGATNPVKEKLKALAGLIEVRQNSLEQLQKSNRWSIPLASIGLVLTLLFGLISLVK